VLRRFQPGNVVEVGSGFSTRVMRRAIKDGNLATRITSIDPHPNTNVQPYADEYIKAPVEDVEIARILKLLSAGDILFIDSSHTVKTGGDVPYLFLEVLPRLKPGVLIHIHDVFLPFDYPEQWVLNDWGWTEQYLVHAFLAYNRTFEILWPARYMWQHHQETIIEIIPSAAVAGSCPTSLWLKKLA
jgi:predicted O-methyltransferase YrrM